MKRTIILSFCIALCLASARLVSAQTAYPGTVIRLPSGEPYFDVRLDPGKTYQGSFIVQHQYEDPDKVVLLYVVASDFEYDSATNKTNYPVNSFKFDAATSMVDWITFNQSQIRMDHYGQETKVEFVIHVPQDALPGTRYANILVSNASPDIQIGQTPVKGFEGAGVVSRLVAASVLVTVNGEKEQSVHITSLRVNDPIDGDGFLSLFHSLGPVTVNVTVENNGNQVLLPGGDIFIHTGDNASPDFHAELNPSRIRVLPNTTRDLSATWDDSLLTATKEGTLDINLQEAKGLNWGRYFAEVDMLYTALDGSLEKVTQVIPFWILPWRFILLILAIIAGAMLYFNYQRRTKVEFMPSPISYRRPKGGN